VRLSFLLLTLLHWYYTTIGAVWQGVFIRISDNLFPFSLAFYPKVTKTTKEVSATALRREPEHVMMISEKQKEENPWNGKFC
jgi:hypothetical protein